MYVIIFFICIAIVIYAKVEESKLDKDIRDVMDGTYRKKNQEKEMQKKFNICTEIEEPKKDKISKVKPFINTEIIEGIYFIILSVITMKSIHQPIGEGDGLTIILSLFLLGMGFFFIHDGRKVLSKQKYIYEKYKHDESMYK